MRRVSTVRTVRAPSGRFLGSPEGDQHGELVERLVEGSLLVLYRADRSRCGVLIIRDFCADWHWREFPQRVHETMPYLRHSCEVDATRSERKRRTDEKASDRWISRVSMMHNV